MKRRGRLTRAAAVVFCMMALLFLFPASVNADTGPKPSVEITLKGLGDELCYGTLLSEDDSTGPSWVWDGTEEDARYKDRPDGRYSYVELDYETWKAFVDYKDSDGFYFLQEGWRCDKTKKLSWNYYPPDVFKILLYFPEKNTFAVSDVCKCYAFDSYFEAKVSEDSSGARSVVVDETALSEKKTEYDVRKELCGLAARMVITVLLEAAIALLFGYCAKKQILFIVGVNVATQIVLNVLLNVFTGHLSLPMLYFLAELTVFVIEAVLYGLFLDRLGKKKRTAKKAVVYALAANLVSFGAGLILAQTRLFSDIF